MAVGSLLQSEYWARLKGTFGWRERWFDSPVRGGEPLLVLLRSFGPLTLAYAGHAYSDVAPEPGGEAERLRAIAEQLRALRSRLPGGTMLFRWDVPWDAHQFDTEVARGAGLRPGTIRVQPPDTVLVDLEAEEPELLARMKPKTRYNIRLAERHGVTVRRAGIGAVPLWYHIYRQTAQRDRITIHPEHYYRTVMELAGVMESDGLPAPEVCLYLAEHEGDVLAGILVTHWNGVATYLYGASADIKRNLMANYLLQWSAMQRARDAGCSSYDLFGIPPNGEDPTHPMHGLYRFKTGFGGSILHRPGCYDMLYTPLSGRLFRRAEDVRQWYYHSYRKRVTA